ncbi:MAG: substrate-binding domain-containing protein [Treponema sp.]|jgi:phosphate transport system substrate-binding protein|nr:substrate-binding domain-containing protein [Treponema sp.]
MEEKTRKTVKILISVFIGIVISVLSLIVLVLLLFSTQREILITLLFVSYVSIIVFLISWNKIKSKVIYFLFLVSVVCIISGAAVIKYQFYVDEIPTVNQDISLGGYAPFGESGYLAELDEESKLNINDNLPVLDGATALYPVYASFVQAVYPKGNYYVNDYKPMSGYPVFCNKTDGAYDNLFEGKADIIFCAEPSDTQLKRFTDNGIKVKFTAIGREAFVFFVNKENKVNNLTIENIQGIYSGRIKNWKKVNGANRRIRAFQRPKNSGSQTLLEKIMGGNPIIKPRRENVSWGMGTIINQVADYRNFSNAIGYSFLFFSTKMVKNDHIKLLSVNGISPSTETIQDNSYPFSESFYAIYIENDEKNENIESFIEWILSEQGQTLVQRTGYVPIKNQQ